MRHGRWLVLGALVVPRLVWAANLGPLADLADTGIGLVGAGYLFGAGWIVWKGIGVFSAYSHRDIDGMGEVFKAIAVTVIGGLLIGVIIPRLVAVPLALGATL